MLRPYTIPAPVCAHTGPAPTIIAAATTHARLTPSPPARASSGRRSFDRRAARHPPHDGTTSRVIPSRKIAFISITVAPSSDPSFSDQSTRTRLREIPHHLFHRPHRPLTTHRGHLRMLLELGQRGPDQLALSQDMRMNRLRPRQQLVADRARLLRAGCANGPTVAAGLDRGSRSSSSFEPKCRKTVTSLTPAASAIRRVVVPRQPCSAKSWAVTSSSDDLMSMGRYYLTTFNVASTYLHQSMATLGAISEAGRCLFQVAPRRS